MCHHMSSMVGCRHFHLPPPTVPLSYAVCPQVMLGSGDPELESWMTWAESAYHDEFRGWVGFSVPVAHRITAG